MTISNELLDSLLADYKTPEDLIGEGGLLKQLTKRLVERALQTEMVEHLGYAKHESVAHPTGNTRNGTSKKTQDHEHHSCLLHTCSATNAVRALF